MPSLATTKACTGCSACENICPHKAIFMEDGAEGFLFPNIDLDKCVECKLCEKACPIVNGKKYDICNPETTECYALWSNIDRTYSSSGGAFSAIARYVISQGGIVFGASWINGFECEHIAIEREDDLYLLRGSKYLQSKINSTFKEIKSVLKTGRRVLFTGTPCQVGGLKSYLGKEYDDLISVDIVCHGVPSNKLFKSYISKLKREFPRYKKASGFGFRNQKAWGCSPHFTSKMTKQSLVGVKNAYMYAFDKALIFRNSCYECQFNGLKRVGDITIADFWGIGQTGIPFKHNVSQGVSLVLVNNDLGRYVMSQLKDVFKEKREISEAIKRNGNIINSSPYSSIRGDVINAFLSDGMTLSQICKDYSLIQYTPKAIIERLLSRLNLFFPLKRIYNKLHL